MKKVFNRLLQYEKGLAVTGIVFFVMAGAVLAVGNNDGVDIDGDGVVDSADMCLNTVPDQSTDWGTNRYLWFGAGSDFFSLYYPDGNKDISDISIRDTKGCSCFDILKTRNASDNAGQYKSGCTKGTLEEWVKKSSK